MQYTVDTGRLKYNKIINIRINKTKFLKKFSNLINRDVEVTNKSKFTIYSIKSQLKNIRSEKK